MCIRCVLSKVLVRLRCDGEEKKDGRKEIGRQIQQYS
jgi:hypothetical protein